MTPGKSATASAELLKQLESKNPAEVLKALNKLEKAGNVRDLPGIIRVMAGISDRELLGHFTIFLCNVRSKEAPAIMAQSLANPAYAKIRTDLTRACWESQLDYSLYLILFAHLFITGDFVQAVEAFSVIEYTSIEHPVNKGLLKEISILVKNSLPDQPETKQRLTRELILVLEPFVTEG